MVRCRCACGTVFVTRLDGLKRGSVLSCGCWNRKRVAQSSSGRNRSKVVVGAVYHGTTVLARLPNHRDGSALFRCKCSCGNIHELRGCCLTGSRPLHCRKCGYTAHLKKVHDKNKKPEGESACLAAYQCYRNSCARKRNIPWDISYDEWKSISTQACHYCGCPPSNGTGKAGKRNGKYVYNGMDRVNNDAGYTLSNVVPCCKRCNHAKCDQTVEQFLTWAAAIHRHLSK